MERINLQYWNNDEIKALTPKNFIEREIGNELLLTMNSRKILFLFGPRQSGKTSLIGWSIHKLIENGVLRQNINYASMDYLDLHPLISDTRKLLKLLKEESDSKHRIFLFIDEIQRLENSGLILKQIYDANMNIQLITSGSSIIKIKDKTSEHLTGRKVSINLYPFSFLEFLKAKKRIPDKWIRRYSLKDVRELVELFGKRLSSLCEEYTRNGGYPEMVLTSKKKHWLYSGLFSTYLEKDVGSLLSSANFQKFKDYANLIALEVGKIYNRQSISRVLGRDARTIEKFEDILLATLVLFRLTPFYSNVRKELRKAPRFYFVDTGFRNYISGDTGDKPITGFELENNVVSEIYKSLANKETFLHWWRTKGGAEVDLVLKKRKEIIPIEIKGIREKKPKLTRSFISFLDSYKPKRAYFITCNYSGETNYKSTKIYYLPFYIIGLLKEF